MLDDDVVTFQKGAGVNGPSAAIIWSLGLDELCQELFQRPAQQLPRVGRRGKKLPELPGGLAMVKKILLEQLKKLFIGKIFSHVEDSLKEGVDEGRFKGPLGRTDFCQVEANCADAQPYEGSRACLLSEIQG
jgi:hypothetical protein